MVHFFFQGLLTDQTIRSHVTQNGIVFNNRKPNAPAQHKRYLDVTDVWPTTANQSIKINLNTYTSRIFCNQDAYCLFVLVEIMAQNNVKSREDEEM